MANEFFRLPIVGGDNNSWGGYLLSLVRSSIGEYSSYLYNDGGTLKISPGRIGINDGVNSGISVIDTATTIAITGTNGRWYRIEMTVSGTAVTFTSTVLADGTAAILPATLTGSYITTKQGFYHVATSRLLGVVWKDSTGVLGGVINCQNMINGFRGYVYLDSPTNEAKMYYDWCRDYYKRWVEYNPATKWNMEADSVYQISHNLGTEWVKIKNNLIYVKNTNETRIDFLCSIDTAGTSGGGQITITSTLLLYSRVAGGTFDSANWNAATVNANIELTM